MNIKTSYDPPPVPFRNCDWTAYDNDTYDGPGCPVGHGATEQAAIDDLNEQIELQRSRREDYRRTAEAFDGGF